MQDWSSLLFLLLDTLIKVLVPIIAGFVINFLTQKIGRERFGLARDIICSLVATLEQQYRSGEITKHDRFALALEHGMKKTGLKEEQVAQLIKEAVFQMNAQLGKYDYRTAAPQTFILKGDAKLVSKEEEQEPLPTGSLLDNIVIPGRTGEKV